MFVLNKKFSYFYHIMAIGQIIDFKLVFEEKMGLVQLLKLDPNSVPLTSRRPGFD